MVEVPYPRTEACIRRQGSRPAGGRVRAWLVAGLILLAPHVVAAQVLSGSYTGDGTDNRAIDELNFQPDVVIIKGDNTQIGVIRTSSMSGDFSKPMTGGTGLTANLIQSLDASGFTIGSDARVNTNNIEYYWIAFKEGSKRLEVGSYAGNGGNPRTISGLGFSPDFLIVMSAGGSEAVWRSTADTESFNFATSGGSTTWITGLGASDFTVTNDARVNAGSTTYHYIAWNEVGGVMDVGSYSGDGNENRNITGLGFQPEYVFIKQDGGQEAVHHPASLGQSTDDTLFFLGVANLADRIQALIPNGFQVGTALDVNEGTLGYRYVAWRRVVKQTEVLSGTYMGDGTDNRAITGLGFTPDLVIIKGDTTENAVLRSYTMSGDAAKDLIDGSISSNRIQSLDAEGFTVGTDARVNTNGTTYYWVAWAAGAGEMTFGTYTGNGTAGRNITDLGFSPDFVIVAGTSNEAVYRNSAATASFNFDATRDTTWISAMGTDGFTVGSSSRVNASGESYGFVAWNEVAGEFDVGTYTGNGADNRSITGVGFLPEYAFVHRDTTGFNALHHPASIGTSTDLTLFFDNRGAFANYIQALESDGFQVGTQSNINASGAPYVFAAWKRPTLTAVRMASAKAARTEKGVTVTWRTGSEVDNLGFEVYREVAGERTRVTTKPIAGSALLVPQGFTTVGRPYNWTDESPQAIGKDVKDVSYWIEDIDLNGKRTWHGPIVPAAQKSTEGKEDTQASEPVAPTTVAGNSPLLEELKVVEPQPRDPAVQPAGDDAPLAPTAPARQPEGPIYSGWIGAPIRRDPSGQPGTASSTPAPAVWGTPQPQQVSPGTTQTVGVSAPTAPQTAAPSQPTMSTAQVQATPATMVTAPAPPAVAATSASAAVVPLAAPPTVPANLRIRRPPVSTSVAGAPRPGPSAELREQWTIASQPATRVMVRTAGWYRLTQPALVAAGINPAVNPKNLRLVVEGVERPMRYVGDEDDLTFDAGDALEFYATGVDTPFTDLRAYWITAGASPALRLPSVDASAPGTPAGDSFWHTVERKDRSVFFAALQNGDEENFFGPLIMDGSPTDQDLTLPQVYTAGTQADLEVALQGVTALPATDDHRVGVFVNGIEVGEMVFDGRTAAVTSFPVAHALLTSGPNTISLEARGGVDDMTLVDYVRLTYQRELRADANQLTLNAEGGHELNVAGFTSDSIRVFDVTGDVASQELLGTPVDNGGTWSMRVTVPGSATRKLFVATSDVLGTPTAVQADVASALNNAGQAGEVVMITDAAFASALTPLSNLRQSQGYTVKVVDVQDVYDEFSFGQKTPVAIRDFLVRAADSWAKPPRFVLLVGNATSDPRNYQGLNEPDFVPTRIVATDVLETASDDWFVDADNDGFAELAAIGRLPGRTGAEVSTMVDKIVAYEQSSPEAWHNSVLLVSDQGDTDVTEFSVMNDVVGGLAPSGYQVNHLKRAEDPTPASTFRTRLSEGAVLVNYQGHGSVDIWRGDVLTAADVPALDNGSRLPLVVAMTCFAGFFHGLFPEESLAEALLRAPGGGAVGVWASSGMTDARWQSSMDRELFRQMFRGGWTSVGEAIRAAKKVVGNQDIRRTWIFFGDPALRLKGLSRSPVESTPTVTPAPAPPDPVESESSPEENDGRYRRAANVATRLADFDGDGRDDALLVQPETGSWLSTIGAPGSFQYTPGQFNVTGEPLALKLNDDNRADLFVYDAQSGQWLQAMSTGDGRFLTSTGTWHAGLEVVTGDFDGNGRDDLFARYFDGRWFQAFSDGEGYYQQRYGLGLGPGHLYAADFNADGLADIFAYDAPTGQWTMAFSVNGSAPSMTYGTWTPGWQPVIARLNNDNAADLILWHAESGAWVQCFRDSSPLFVYRTGSWAPGGRVHALDLNGDGRDELLRYDWRTGDWTLATLNGVGEMQQWDGLWETGWELTPGDLNADGRLDLLLYNPDTGEWIRRLNLVSGWTDDVSGLWSRNWTVAGRRR